MATLVALSARSNQVRKHSHRPITSMLFVLGLFYIGFVFSEDFSEVIERQASLHAFVSIFPQSKPKTALIRCNVHKGM